MIWRTDGSSPQTMTGGGYRRPKIVPFTRLVGRAGFEPATFCTSSELSLSEREPSLRETCIDWDQFREWAFRKYADSYAPTVICYAKKYRHLMFGNLAELEAFSDSKRNSVLKALISLSKYSGTYRAFKARQKAHGLGWSRTSSVDAFLRIMSNRNSDVLEWLSEVVETLNDRDLSTFLRFCALSGLRKGEAVNSFNLMIELQRNGLSGEYYDRDTQTLEHFKYPKLFLRRTKNVFISMVPRDLVREILESKPITYDMIQNRLYRRGLPTRIQDLRDYWGTFMLRHGLIKEEVDLLQGRISKSIFVRHYWSPAIQNLRTRVFAALDQLKPLLP